MYDAKQYHKSLLTEKLITKSTKQMYMQVKLISYLALNFVEEFHHEDFQGLSHYNQSL